MGGMGRPRKFKTAKQEIAEVIRWAAKQAAGRYAN
jgi:hypothetical protein